MRRKAVLLLALTLGGCFPDQGSDVAACEVEARRFFATFRTADPNDPVSRYIVECMAVKGYDFSIGEADCSSQHPLPTQGACYVPQNWLANLYDQARRRLKPD